MNFQEISLILGVVFAIFVYKDASGRSEKYALDGPPSPILWAIIAFLFGIVGLIAYAIKLSRVSKRYNARISSGGAAGATSTFPPYEPPSN